MDAKTDSMRGRNCMITGASSGIGRATAIELAKLGASLVLVCRDRTRGEETVAAIKAAAPDASVDLMIADLSSQQSIRKLAAEFLARNQPLHVLVNNAGVANTRRTLTVDGIETTFAVNHLAYFMLTMLLLERIKQSAPARIINVASDAHSYGTMNFDDLGGERRYRTMRIYGQSKLANIMFTYELARRLEGTHVTVNCLHPGTVATGLGKNNGGFARFVVSALGPFVLTAAQGAATQIYLATSPEVEAVSGQYFIKCKPAPSRPESYDRSKAARLWEISAQMTGVGDPAELRRASPTAP